SGTAEVGMAELRQPASPGWQADLFRLLAENVQDYALFVVDPQRHVLSWSRGAERRKNEFLVTLAHELRNPLAPLRNGLQLMKLAGGDADTVEQARGMMERQLAQMVRLIDDLLDVSRITRGKLELRKERVDLADVVQNAVEGSRPLIEASAHRLTVALPP